MNETTRLISEAVIANHYTIKKVAKTMVKKNRVITLCMGCLLYLHLHDTVALLKRIKMLEEKLENQPDEVSKENIE